jgi:hypothetical protein
MSLNQLRNEIDTMILNSGMNPHIKMRCSILRALKMRHQNIDPSQARNVIEIAIKELS